MSKRLVSLCLYLNTRTHTITWALFESVGLVMDKQMWDTGPHWIAPPVPCSCFRLLYNPPWNRFYFPSTACPDTDLKAPHSKAMRIFKPYYSLGSNVTATPSGTILVNARWGTHLCILGVGLMTLWLSTDVTPADWKLSQFPMKSRGIAVLVLLTYPFKTATTKQFITDFLRSHFDDKKCIQDCF